MNIIESELEKSFKRLWSDTTPEGVEKLSKKHKHKKRAIIEMMNTTSEEGNVGKLDIGEKST